MKTITENIVMKSKKLNIPYKKTCSCDLNHINCLTAKEWVKHQVGIWECYYEKRDVRDKDIHPAVFPISLPTRCIETFTHKGELVLDPFAGIGSTLIAAKDLGRNAVGFDLNKKYIDYAKKRLGQKTLEGSHKQVLVHDDAINIPEYLENETIALSVTSPPYANMLNRPRLNKSMRADKRENKHFKKVQQYSNDPRDLGTMDHAAFSEALTKIYGGIFPLMKPKAHCVININDLWWENKRIPTHVYVINALEKTGFELRNIFVWDKRNLVNGVGIFGWPSNFIKLGTTFEYILDFWKPKTD